MTFLPATSTVSQTLPAYKHKEHTLSVRSKKYGIVSTSEKKKKKHLEDGNTSIYPNFQEPPFVF
jgi:hypothetical protein